MRGNMTMKTKMLNRSISMKCLRKVLAKLLESDVIGVLSEALATHVQVILPDETMFVAAGSAAAGSLSELPWTTEPDILMTHADQILKTFFFSCRSESNCNC